MKKQLSILASVVALAVLAACGGGGDSSTGTTGTTSSGGTTGTASGSGATGTTATAAVVDKYQGTWVGCFATNPGSGKEVITIAKTSDTTVSFSYVDTAYASTDCSGTGTAAGNGSGTVVLNGTKTIGADTVDKGTVTEGNKPSEKQVFLVKGTAPVTLTTGRTAADGGAVDADGYPTTMNTNSLTKQ